jgi:hypothetical protein
MKILFFLWVGIHQIYSSNYLKGLVFEEPQYGDGNYSIIPFSFY